MNVIDPGKPANRAEHRIHKPGARQRNRVFATRTGAADPRIDLATAKLRLQPEHLHLPASIAVVPVMDVQDSHSIKSVAARDTHIHHRGRHHQPLSPARIRDLSAQAFAGGSAGTP